MASLALHEKLAHGCLELPDDTLVSHTLELHRMLETNVVPRQIDVIRKLLGYIAFEARMRLQERDGTPVEA